MALLGAAGCATGECEGSLASVQSESGVSRLAVCAEVAATDDARRRGLVGRPALLEGEGLLLDFPAAGDVCLITADLAYDIDAILADADGRVIAVERSLPAGQITPRCHAGVHRVLELVAGGAASVGIGYQLVVESL